MALREFGCGTCSLITEEIEVTYKDKEGNTKVRAPRQDVYGYPFHADTGLPIEVGGVVIAKFLRDDGVKVCPFCGSRDWLLITKIYDFAHTISEKSRPRPSSPWQSLRSEREIFPIQSHFIDKEYYRTPSGQVKARRIRKVFNTKKEYEQYMADNNYVYYEEPLKDVREEEYINDRHKDLHKQFGDRYRNLGDAKFMTEQEIQNAVSVK